MFCLAKGYGLMKLFPAEIVGGRTWPSAIAVACVGGTWIADRQAIAEEQYDAIAQHAEAALKLTET